VPNGGVPGGPYPGTEPGVNDQSNACLYYPMPVRRREAGSDTLRDLVAGRADSMYVHVCKIVRSVQVSRVDRSARLKDAVDKTCGGEMSIGARYQPGAVRSPFVNRKEIIAAFAEEIERLGQRPRLIELSGVGGIGKSRLLHELRRRAPDDVVTALLNLQEPEQRSALPALGMLRSQFGAAGVRFDRFDVAYAVWWQRLNPMVPLSVGRLPWAAESEVLASVLDEFMLGVPVVATAVKVLDVAARKFKRWNTIRHDQTLRELDEMSVDRLGDAVAYHGGLSSVRWGWSGGRCGHLGPQEPGQFPGDRDCDHVTAVFTGVQLAESGAQSLLGGPGPGGRGRAGAFLTAAQGHADTGTVLVGPRRFDHLGAQVGVAGLGDVSAAHARPRGVLAGGQAGEAHECARAGEPAPVADLAGDRQRPELGDAAVAGQAGHRVGERPVGEPVPQVGLQRGQLGIPRGQHRPVVAVGGLQRWFVEALGVQPLLMTAGPRPLPPDPVVAQQELADPVPDTGAVADYRRACPAQVPDCLFGLGRDPDRHQLPGPVQPGQPPAVPLVGRS
jgi:hypothetical protein